MCHDKIFLWNINDIIDLQKQEDLYRSFTMYDYCFAR